MLSGMAIFPLFTVHTREVGDHVVAEVRAGDAVFAEHWRGLGGSRLTMDEQHERAAHEVATEFGETLKRIVEAGPVPDSVRFIDGTT